MFPNAPNARDRGARDLAALLLPVAAKSVMGRPRAGCVRGAPRGLSNTVAITHAQEMPNTAAPKSTPWWPQSRACPLVRPAG
jgi:hypothetical protein